MTENEQVAPSENASANAASSTTSNVLETAENVLNTVGDKVVNVAGQNETVQKTTTFVEENVLKANKQQDGPATDDKAVDNVPDEQIEEFMRHQNRSYQG
ncbi:hypothetical protein TSTA_046600 [Talaromyces stipitatus ATCC 10500]|uniref:Uncharacterized protein n=1 Tax=Talaromyces stipitatus (strain ATCC 10500 / CBS 375.48 / QM 6759 / NRRL 1006) TaxID=441959 RepID=B8MJK6_TALSN|nr:uncharacterized protein TSTA_046600 [Talaromyces stipitatus ATCC 10500]EED15206.1 hypothetical protein TSTA_046600 [Talaromyces stipitatus ATCC 10500]